ncbi:bifunctional riboflavin kinase/FAD synthetase [Shimia ponticola]|uniref:bifunctional riboflavin kinase/FAD synthetase n=1 Tax=Shimia ponticola TaxID=2582893 RepID=UPI0011BF35A0|nr:bifunctional riboflavin kinase/FAD synthetase [Shimia ponticola]
MQRYTSLSSIPSDARGASVAVGNFDGVHLGHQAVIDIARQPDAPLGVVTFEPHPRQFFAEHRQMDLPPFRLTDAQARANRLEKLGVDLLFEMPFTANLAALTPEAFVNDILLDGIGARHVVVGQDFFFGKNRAGNADTLVELGRAAGIDVTVAPLVGLGETEVSSTNIRKALGEGRPADAAKMLGHWHRIVGPVIHGEKRGRELGYPTANMSIAGLHPPAFGVYAVVVDVLDGTHAGTYHGAASIGVRPMFGENIPNCETFIFDFKGDLYGANLSVGLVSYLRGEEKFDSLDALITQMSADCDSARDILSAL